ncbi:hypothetical protein B9Z55_017505 [Caenorhabditis nigoni]|uniref:G-protein coupled receptors family 1 profile domain-containing protein n=3 Tax=Caenorhabditis nigoni TaxID=1611254 RepID=A0A2G5T9D6_9PELO|nr:hypothetical protein B9Z55_017505 [Caenorhabditis nigoni]
MKVDLHPQLPAVLTVLLDISGTVDICTNSLVVYLIIFKSPALKSFRYYLLYSQLNTAVVDVYLAFLMKPVPIFPAMGGYTTGILATWFGISSHVQMTIMIFNMGMQAVAIFQTFLAKHQAIVSIDRRRVLRKLFYWGLVGIGYFLTIVTIVLYYLGDISKEQQVEYIRKNIPELEQILMSHPSLDIYDRNANPLILYACCMLFFGPVLGFTSVSVLSFDIILILRRHKSVSSNRNIKQHRDIFRSIFAQFLVISFCFLPPTTVIIFIIFEVPNTQELMSQKKILSAKHFEDHGI